MSLVMNWQEGKKIPCDGELYYQGYNVMDLVDSISDRRFGFEETTYLLLFGQLPNKQQLLDFEEILTSLQELSGQFVRDVIMKAPSANIMNALQKSVLTLYSYDDNPDNIEVSNVLRQSLQLIGKLPMIAVYAYHSYRHFKFDDNLYIRHTGSVYVHCREYFADDPSERRVFAAGGQSTGCGTDPSCRAWWW